MTYMEAYELSQRIKQERPELIPKLSAYGDECLIIIKKTVQPIRGYQPQKLGHPFFVRDEQDWVRLRNNL